MKLEVKTPLDKELEELGVTLRESDDPDRLLIDFHLDDGEDEIASCWGDRPDDVDFECKHPYDRIDFDDADNTGQCRLCGQRCDWEWVKDVVDEGHDTTGSYYATTGEVREVVEWYPLRNPGGVIGVILKESR